MYRFLPCLLALSLLGCGMPPAGQEPIRTASPASLSPSRDWLNAPLPQAVALLETTTAIAAPPVETPNASDGKPTFEKDVLPVIDKYCVRCHSGPKPRGSFAMDGFKKREDALLNPTAWEKIAENLRSRAMPPDGKPRPSEEQLNRLNTWIDIEIYKVDCTGPRDPGRVTMRRLNRAE